MYLLNGNSIGTYLGINRAGRVQGELKENGMDRRVVVESLDGSNHFRLSCIPGHQSKQRPVSSITLDVSTSTDCDMRQTDRQTDRKM